MAVIAVLLLALGVANRIGARRGSIYLLLGLGLWAGFFMSGLHATLAGVLTALFVPARVTIAPGALPQVIHRGADDIEAQALDNEPDAMDPDRVAIIGAIGGSLDAATAPLQRLERSVQPWVTYGILQRQFRVAAEHLFPGLAVQSKAKDPQGLAGLRSMCAGDEGQAFAEPAVNSTGDKSRFEFAVGDRSLQFAHVPYAP